MPSSLCIFDLDRTLVDGSTVDSWILFLGRAGIIDGPARLAQRKSMNQRYLDGSVSLSDYFKVQCAEIAGLSHPQVQALLAEWTRTEMATMISPKARAQVDSHKARGDLIVIASASCEILAQSAALELGVGLFLGGLPEIDASGFYTGRQIGPPAFAAGKLARVKELLVDLGLAWSSFSDIHAYSDSSDDLPLLLAATHPVAVDPDAEIDAELLRIADELGWPVISLARPGL